jgi:hypothetical protein
MKEYVVVVHDEDASRPICWVDSNGRQVISQAERSFPVYEEDLAILKHNLSSSLEIIEIRDVN